MNLLIVDDRATNLKLLRAQLEAEGHTVVEAPDGVAALALLEHQPVDAIITDILMPRMDGYRLCHEIRKHERLHDLPIIAYTATYTSASDAKLALDMGADKYLEKPAPVASLVAALQEVTSLKAELRPRLVEGLPEAGLMKEYSEALVTKLEQKNAELSVSEVQYRRLFEAAKDGILILNAETGEIDDVNPYLTTLLGFTKAQMLRKKVWELGCFQHLVADQEKFAELKRNEYVTYNDLPLETVDGRKIAVEFVSNVYEVNGTRVVQCNIRNITERKQAEASLRASEKRYHSLFENMLDGLAHCRMIFEQERPQDFLYLDVNHAFEAMTGLKHVVGRRVTEVIPGIRETNPEMFEIYGRVAVTGRPERFEIYLEQLKAWLEVSVYSIEKECFVAVFQNITGRKRAGEVLKQRVAELERFHRLSVGRELQMIDLKKEVNELAGQAGRTPPYDLAFLGGKMGPQTKP